MAADLKEIYYQSKEKKKLILQLILSILLLLLPVLFVPLMIVWGYIMLADFQLRSFYLFPPLLIIALLAWKFMLIIGMYYSLIVGVLVVYQFVKYKQFTKKYPKALDAMFSDVSYA